MAVEIKELLIKAVVSKPAEERKATVFAMPDLERMKREIIQQCIDEVMEKIREQKER
jgi:Family of unknown function (DUF5908)